MPNNDVKEPPGGGGATDGLAGRGVSSSSGVGVTRQNSPLSADAAPGSTSFPRKIFADGGGKGEVGPAAAAPSNDKNGTQHGGSSTSARGRDWYWDGKCVDVTFFGSADSSHCHFCFRRISTNSGRPSLLIQRCCTEYIYCSAYCKDIAAALLPLKCESDSQVRFALH